MTLTRAHLAASASRLDAIADRMDAIADRMERVAILHGPECLELGYDECSTPSPADDPADHLTPEQILEVCGG